MSYSDLDESTVSKTLDLLASGSGYGSFSKHVDCNSALALIGLILFLDILRDLVEDITADGARRKRDLTFTLSENSPELASFVLNGGIEQLQGSFNESISYLYKDKEMGLEEKLCRMNRDLRDRHGLAGRLIGTLLSNVIGRFKSSSHSQMASLMEASKTGRTQKSCDVIKWQ